MNYPKNRHEIILVDNGSADDTIGYVKKNFPLVKILGLDKNYGFAAANNKALEIAGGDYILFLNQDTKVDKNFLTELVKVAMGDSSIGICGSMIKDYYRQNTIQSLGFDMDIACSTNNIGEGEIDRRQFKDVRDVFYVLGASLLIKRVVLSRLKYCFDADFFMYAEEVDLCWRTRLLGYRVVTVPRSIVYHKAPINPRTMVPINVFRNKRNFILTIRKNLRTPLKQIVLSLFLIRTLFALLYWSRKGRWPFGLSFMRALFAPINRDLDMRKVSLGKQLSVFKPFELGLYLHQLRSYLRLFGPKNPQK